MIKQVNFSILSNKIEDPQGLESLNGEKADIQVKSQSDNILLGVSLYDLHNLLAVVGEIVDQNFLLNE